MIYDQLAAMAGYWYHFGDDDDDDDDGDDDYDQLAVMAGSCYHFGDEEEFWGMNTNPMSRLVGMAAMANAQNVAFERDNGIIVAIYISFHFHLHFCGIPR